MPYKDTELPALGGQKNPTGMLGRVTQGITMALSQTALGSYTVTCSCSSVVVNLITSAEDASHTVRQRMNKSRKRVPGGFH